MEGVRLRNSQTSNMGYERLSTGRGRYTFPYKRVATVVYAFLAASGLLLFTVTVHNVTPLTRGGHSVSLLDQLSVPLGMQERVHAVVLDAGSTGSRVLAFTFLRSSADNSLKLESQLWHEVKPGLSSYANDPAKGAASLAPLLAMALDRVPSASRPLTPLVLKATAGLRLLKEEAAQGLLDHVRKDLQASEFHTDDRCVEIMDGSDEGIFSWFTLNYLMDRVGSASPSLVALDLGGGSTQVTFVPEEEVTLKQAADTQLSSVSLLGRETRLFTHSYLGLGLMAARHSVLAPEEGNTVVTSACLSPAVETAWTYGGETFTVRGRDEGRTVTVAPKEAHLGETLPTADYDACVAQCVGVIRKQVSWVPEELRRREVVAFSYFFDRATESGLIDPHTGGTVTVSQFAAAAKSACEAPNADQPFACLDLAFIASFLSEGYKLPLDGEVKLHKRVDGYDLSWALGLAFHVVTNGV